MLYGKLTESCSLITLDRVPYVSNATPEIFKEYAEENGYLEVKQTTSPGRFYTSHYEVKDDKIEQVWTANDLEDSKRIVMDEILMSLNEQLVTRVVIPCTLGFNVVYDVDAQINLLGLLSTGMGTDFFIDADNNIHKLSDDELKTVAASVMSHKQKLYANATQLREKVSEAKSVDELEKIQTSVFVEYEL